MTQTPADGSYRHVRECHEALFEEALTHKIIGGFHEVYRALGHGFVESVYAKALELELAARNLHVTRTVATEVRYKGAVVGIFRADMLVESRVVLELRAGRRCDTAEIAQLLNYLRATELELGLLLHFGPRPSFKRLIASNEYASRPYRRSPALSASSATTVSTDGRVTGTRSSPQ